LLKRRCTSVLTTAMAVLAISASCTVAASASTVNISPSGANSMSASPLTIKLGAASWACNYTLASSLLSSALNTPGTTLGTISGGTISACTPSGVTGTINGPFNLTLNGVATAGAVPVVINQFAFTLQVPGIGTCPYKGNLPASLNPPTSVVLGTNSFAWQSGGSIACARTLSLSGTFQLQHAVTVTIT
jgi:hypothetical protein